MLLTHSSNDGDQQVLTGLEVLGDVIAQLLSGELDIRLGVTRVGHQGKESILNIDQLVLLADDVGDIHVVGGWADILVLLAGENVDTDEIDLGVTVLAGLRGAHVDNLAGLAGNVDESILAEGRALDWVEKGGTRGGGIEGLIFFFRHLEQWREARVKFFALLSVAYQGGIIKIAIYFT